LSKYGVIYLSNELFPNYSNGSSTGTVTLLMMAIAAAAAMTTRRRRCEGRSRNIITDASKNQNLVRLWADTVRCSS
jgi:hypothetical protein